MKKNPIFLNLFSGAIAAAALLTSQPISAAVKATHGMVLFGKGASYISHLPMYHSPHDFQFVAKVTLRDLPGQKTLAAYQTQKNQGAKFFTLVPEPLDLENLISTGSGTFKGQIFKDHFEKQTGVLLGSVMVQVTSELVGRKLDATQAELGQYFVFGEGGEYYAVHQIQGRPNLDLIASVSQPMMTVPFTCPSRLCGKYSFVPIHTEMGILIMHQGVGLPESAVPLVPGDMLQSLDGILTSVKDVIYSDSQDLSH